MSRQILTTLGLVGVLLFASCDGDKSSDGTADGAGREALIGTWVEIDSDPELSSNGDTMYVNRDTVYSIFAEDGSYTEVQRLWSKDVHSSNSDGQYHLSAGTYRGSWSVSGNQLSKTVTYDLEPESETVGFSVSGSTLTLRGSHDGRPFSVVLSRHAGSVPGVVEDPSGTVAAPTFSPAAGTYSSSQSVTLTSATGGAIIHYTIDGTVPTASSTVYAGPITVASSRTIKAIAVKSGSTNSAVSSAAYTIGGGTVASIPWNSEITYGALTDSRDGKTYRTVKIGSLQWMAENLNYSGSGTSLGSCYANSADSCAKYGRHYTWTESMGGLAPSAVGSGAVRGICPERWHVPSDAEWRDLDMSARSLAPTDTVSLMAKSGWLPFNGRAIDGTDRFGFRALPAGRVEAGSSSDAGIFGTWWSGTPSPGTDGGSRDQYSLWSRWNASLARGTTMSYHYSLRCVGDGGVPSSSISFDSTLSALNVSAGTLAPSFAASTLAYSDTVDESISSVSIDASPSDRQYGMVNYAVGSGSFGYVPMPISLEAGVAKTIRMRVSNGTHSRIYSITFYRKPKV